MCDCYNRDFKVENGKLYGEYDGDFHEYSHDSYSYCPICGKNLQPERLNPETLIEGDFFPPPWNPDEYPEKTEGWLEFQREMRKNPKYYHQGCDSLNSMET